MTGATNGTAPSGMELAEYLVSPQVAIESTPLPDPPTGVAPNSLAAELWYDVLRENPELTTSGLMILEEVVILRNTIESLLAAFAADPQPTVEGPHGPVINPLLTERRMAGNALRLALNALAPHVGGLTDRQRGGLQSAKNQAHNGWNFGAPGTGMRGRG